jgi:parvulin-like peptidyl-prolyl cis-trans isomerase-like protein
MKLLREPLLHFAVAGGLLFAAYAVLNRGESLSGADRTIRITERELAWLTDTSARAWQRAPDESELQGLVAEYLREELLAREARALELDRDDTVVRRRLAQKMSFILEDTARLASPTEADLRARFDAGRARFRSTPQSTFRQVYFSAAKRGGRAAPDARLALDQLMRGGKVDPAALGDASLLPLTLADADEQTIAGRFGAGFAHAVAKIEVGAWQGPIESEFGLHLVRLTARDEGRPRAFEEVRAQLLDEWRREQDAATKSAYFAGLLRKYDVQATAPAQPLLGPALALLAGAQR